jgi:hypothetical protein
MATTPARGLLLRLLPVLLALTLIGATHPAAAPAETASVDGVAAAPADQDPAEQPRASAPRPDSARILVTQVIADARGSRAPPSVTA